MRQRQLAGNVADGVDAGDVGSHMLVDDDIVPFGNNSDLLQPQAIGVGGDSDGHQHQAACHFLLIGALIEADLEVGLAVGSCIHRGNAGTRHDVDALTGEGSLKLLADFLILVGHHPRQELHQGHVHAVGVPQMRELHPHCARAHDNRR